MQKKKRKLFEFLILITFSITILIVLYRRIDLKEFQTVLENSNIYLLILGFLINVLLGIVSGFKYSYFAKFLEIKPYPKLRTSIESFFIASTFNLVLPSKLADFGKGIICEKLDKAKYPFKLHTYTLYEKISDLFSLLCITLTTLLFFKFSSKCISFSQNIKCDIFIFQNSLLNILLILIFAIFLIISPFINFEIITKTINSKFHKILNKIKFDYQNKHKKFFIYQLCSLIFWLLNILQLIIFGNALQMHFFSLSGILVICITILSGLIPISFAGIGTRELTLTILLKPFYGEIKPLLFGILFTSRYLVPALLGLLFIKKLNFKKTF